MQCTSGYKGRFVIYRVASDFTDKQKYPFSQPCISVDKLRIVEDPPFSVKEGGLIKAGYSQELDTLKDSIKDAQDWIAGLEYSERKRTGIKNLKGRI